MDARAGSEFPDSPEEPGPAHGGSRRPLPGLPGTEAEGSERSEGPVRLVRDRRRGWIERELHAAFAPAEVDLTRIDDDALLAAYALVASVHPLALVGPEADAWNDWIRADAARVYSVVPWQRPCRERIGIVHAAEIERKRFVVLALVEPALAVRRAGGPEEPQPRRSDGSDAHGEGSS